ncbi:unnamed protein product [Cochlearia groenlandica]
MMERTYGRRKPGMSRTLSGSLNDTVSQPPEYISVSSSPDIDPLDYSLLPFSSQDSSSLWHSSSRSSLREDDYPQYDEGVRRVKRPRKNGGGGGEEAFGFTSTLLEAQEFGELMEHEDEVNFALDGLKKGHQVRIRRASLSSLLSICSSQHQRRSLRAQGISQTILNAILSLALDDIPSNLAAATLFFVLTTDSKDENFMESPKCIKFLIKLLKPVTVTSSKEKPLNIGFKLLSFRKDVDAARDGTKMNDPTSSNILLRVQELLVSCKEMRDSYKSETIRPELSTKWVALLAMERSCLSKISFDDTSGSVKKTGGNFKEKLRELGGLDAVLDVVMDCHAVMERWVECDALSVQDKKDNVQKQSLMLLLKCLKIMENATFLSTDNQNHLLGFKKRFGSHEFRMSFTELTISVIKMLSGLKLIPCLVLNFNNGCVSHRSQSIINLDSQPTAMPSSQSSVSGNEPTALTRRVGTTSSASFAGRLASLGSGIARSTSRTLQVGEPSCKRNGKSTSLEESEDPFAFDLEDSKPSKWATVSVKQKKSRAQKKKGCFKESKDEYSYQLFSSQEVSSNHRLDSQEESSDRDCIMLQQPSSSTNDIDEECICLLSDCLLTAVKVLMNLTNDNAVGCRQVGGCRGLECMAELIVGHFPSFTRSPLSSEMETMGLSHQKKDKHLTDQELDFLVAILGLLVNLVEKDGVNRSRLASSSVPITEQEGLQENEQDMIPLLCSIFLTNQGSADTKEVTTTFTLDDEEAVLETEKEAEKMIVEAYSALLLAFLSTESRSIRNCIKDYLPKRNLTILVPVLERFVQFHTTLNMIPPETHKAVMEVIESCKLP